MTLPRSTQKTRIRAAKNIARKSETPSKARGDREAGDLNREADRPAAAGENANNGAIDEPNIMAQRLDKRPFSTGTKVENLVPRDDETTEQMVQEGMDKAEDDDMVLARRIGTKSQG